MAKFNFNLKLNIIEPVYLQLIRYYKTALAKNLIKDGDELPSRRELAVILVINPNTAQKAYAELEAEGLISTQNNVKSVAVVTAPVCENIRTELLEGYMSVFIDNMKSLNVTKEETINHILKKYL